MKRRVGTGRLRAVPAIARDRLGGLVGNGALRLLPTLQLLKQRTDHHLLGPRDSSERS